MARKTLFDQGGGLTALQTTDIEGLGSLYEDQHGNVYRYVKNAGATALVAAGGCFRKLGQSTVKGVFQRVLPCDAATGPATALITMGAGVPVTAIAASGSGTGAYGWIQVAGTKKVTLMQTATAVDQQPGCRAILTGLSTGIWGKCATNTIDSTNGGTVYANCVEVVAEPAATGAATAASVLCQIRCLR
jgi:hypothetical protein